MQWTVHTPVPNPAKLFFFRRAHLPSTCSRVTPTAAINFARSFKPSPNEKEVQNAQHVQIQTKETPCHCRTTTAAPWCGCGRLWRLGRTEHETLAGAADRAAAARCCGGRHHRVQRD